MSEPGPDEPKRRSVYAAVLGADIARLRPELREYFSGGGAAAGTSGIGVGVFERAGSRKPWLGLLARPFAGPNLFLPTVAENVPFRIENRPEFDNHGNPQLRAIRVLHFPGGPATFEDVIEATGDGLLRDRLGTWQRLEMIIRCEALPDGSAKMTSVGTNLRLGRVRIPLRGIFGVTMVGYDSWDDTTGRQRVEVMARNPLIGTVIEYAGWFEYRHASSNPG